MKFLGGFLGTFALAAGLIYAGLNIVVSAIANTAMLFAGIGLLLLNLFALAVWFIDWKYYS